MTTPRRAVEKSPCRQGQSRGQLLRIAHAVPWTTEEHLDRGCCHAQLTASLDHLRPATRDRAVADLAALSESAGPNANKGNDRCRPTDLPPLKPQLPILADSSGPTLALHPQYFPGASNAHEVRDPLVDSRAGCCGRLFYTAARIASCLGISIFVWVATLNKSTE